MTSVDEIARIARLPTTSHDEAVKLIQQYGRVTAASAAADAAADAYDRVLTTIGTTINAPLVPR